MLRTQGREPRAHNKPLEEAGGDNEAIEELSRRRTRNEGELEVRMTSAEEKQAVEGLRALETLVETDEEVREEDRELV